MSDREWEGVCTARDLPRARCGDCYYMNKLGECRRNPPVPVQIGMQITNRWPIMLDDDWCGSFTPGVKGSVESTGGWSTSPASTG